jgi:hypothetical protein
MEESENGHVLVLRNPPLQDKTRYIPWGLVDMLKDDMGSSWEFTDRDLEGMVGFSSEY